MEAPDALKIRVLRRYSGPLHVCMRDARSRSTSPPRYSARALGSVPARCRPSPSRRPTRSAVEKPEPELDAPDDAIVRVDATGVCGSDLHIYHGRVAVEPGFTIGHEYVGTVVAAGDAVRDRRGRRPRARLLPGRLRHLLLLPPRRVPQVRRVADLRPRHGARRPAGHAGRAGARPLRQPVAAQDPRRPLRRRRAVRRRRDGHRLPRRVGAGPAGRHVAVVLGLGPVGLCAIQAALVAGAAQVIAIDTVEQRLEMARSFGASPCTSPRRTRARRSRPPPAGRGVDVGSRPSATPARSSWRSG